MLMRCLFSSSALLLASTLTLTTGLLFAHLLAYPDSFYKPDGQYAFLIKFIENAGLFQQSAWRYPTIGILYLYGFFLVLPASIVLAIQMYCEEKQRKGIRFLLPRVSRRSIFWGRFFALLCQSSVVLCLIYSVFLMVFFIKVGSTDSQFFSEWSVGLANTLVGIIPITLLAMVCGLTRASTAGAMAMFTMVIATSVSLYHITYSTLGYVARLATPGVQIPMQLQISSWESIALWHIPLGQSALLLFCGLYFARFTRA